MRWGRAIDCETEGEQKKVAERVSSATVRDFGLVLEYAINRWHLRYPPVCTHVLTHTHTYTHTNTHGMGGWGFRGQFYNKLIINYKNRIRPAIFPLLLGCRVRVRRRPLRQLHLGGKVAADVVVGRLVAGAIAERTVGATVGNVAILQLLLLLLLL